MKRISALDNNFDNSFNIHQEVIPDMEPVNSVNSLKIVRVTMNGVSLTLHPLHPHHEEILNDLP